MLAVENDSLLLALFVRPLTHSSAPPVSTQSTSPSAPSLTVAASDFAHELLLSFHQQFHPALVQLYPTFLQLNNNPQDASLNEELLPHFAAFTATLCSLLAAAQGQQQPSSSQQRHQQQPHPTQQQQRSQAPSPTPTAASGGGGGAPLPSIELQQRSMHPDGSSTAAHDKAAVQ